VKEEPFCDLCKVSFPCGHNLPQLMLLPPPTFKCGVCTKHHGTVSSAGKCCDDKKKILRGSRRRKNTPRKCHATLERSKREILKKRMGIIDGGWNGFGYVSHEEYSE
jgi:hypothetical protein